MKTIDSQFFIEHEDKIMVEPNSGCWLWIGARTSLGYGVFNGRYVHRMSRERHDGLPIVGSIVRHKCDTPSCVNPDHLLRGTMKDNTRDMYERGRNRNARGEQLSCAVLSDSAVRSAREMAIGGASVAAIARTLRIPYEPIRSAIRGETWKHVSVNPSSGGHERGEARYNSKINADTVRTIRRLRSDGIGPCEIARNTGIKRSTVCAVLSGRNWRHVI